MKKLARISIELILGLIVIAFGPLTYCALVFHWKKSAGKRLSYLRCSYKKMRDWTTREIKMFRATFL